MTNWYAVYTKPRFEKKVASQLIQKGFEIYLPLRKVIKQWSDRKKKVQEPLIKSYVFVKVQENEKDQVYLTNGVVKILHWLGKPAIIRQEEIDAIKIFLGDLDYLPENAWGFIEKGDQISIEQGPFKGQNAEVLSKKKNTLLLNLKFMNQIISVELPMYDMVKKNKSH